jgi:hypothetical protein
MEEGEMGRGNKGLDSKEYDVWLADNKKERELRERHIERRNANKGYSGWHFGIDEKPIFAKDKDDFKKKLAERGLVMRDDVKHTLK